MTDDGDRFSVRCWWGVLALFLAGLALWWYGHHYASAVSDSGYRLGFAIITLGIGYLSYRIKAPDTQGWRSTAKIRRFVSMCAAVGAGLTLSYVTDSVMTHGRGADSSPEGVTSPR